MITEELSPVYLATFGLRREPPLPREDWEPGVEENYDFNTLFYDVFLSSDGRAVTAIFPPLLNCEPAVAAATFRLEPGGTVVRPDADLRQSNGVLRLALPPGAAPASLGIQINGVAISVPIRPSAFADFTDRKVIFAISKNNPLSWIVDWATYNNRVHGADAVLLYDNNSSSYTVADIKYSLQKIEGFKKVVVVPWNFPWGVVVLGRGPAWDSEYCQRRAMAHARWRYCCGARAFLNSDIDELVVTHSGRSIFDHLAASGLPCLTYGGRWVSATRPRWRRRASLIAFRSGADMRHSDCLYLEDTKRYPNKWVADPRSCGSEVRWGVHVVTGLSGAAAQAAADRAPIAEDVEFRHCRQMSLNWKYRRSQVPPYGPAFEFDRLFARTLAVAFPDRHIFRRSGGPLRRIVDFLKQY